MKINVAQVALSMGTGGIENLILNICKKINKDRFNICVICLDYGGELLADLKKCDVRCLVEQRRPGMDWRLILRLATLFREMQFDIVHSHNQASCFYAGFAAFLADVPVSIVTEHSRHNIDSRLIRRVEKRILSCFQSKWVTVSNELAELSIRKDYVNSGKIKVITNGVDPQKFSSVNKADINAVKKRIAINRANMTIIMVARLAKIKNHVMMIHALSILKNDFPDLTLLIVGDGECKQHLMKQANDLNLSCNIRFLGTRTDIPELLALSDIFVLCSHSEGFPLSLIEASAANIPVVITKESNRAGFITNQKNGTVVQGNANSLAAGIKKNIVDRSQAKRMAFLAQQDVFENYSLLATVNQYEELYDNLLARKNR